MVRLTTLGSVDLTSEAGSSDLLEHPKRFAVFAYLAAFPGQRHQRDSLLAMFWPESDESQARNALRQSVHVIRRSLGSKVIVSHHGGLSADCDCIVSDANQFCRFVDEGRLDAAVDVYQGEFLSGFYLEDAPDFERWCDEQQGRIRRMAIDGLRSLSERANRAADFGTAMTYARRGTELFPHNESLSRRLLRLLAQHDDLAEMLEEFERLEHSLRRDLGVEPSDRTAAIVERALSRKRSPRWHGSDRRSPAGRGRRLEDGFTA